MITQYRFSVESEQGKLPSFFAYRMYSWLLEQISREAGEELHQQGETPVSQSLYYDRETGKNIWIVNLLSEQTESILTPILDKVEEIKLHTDTLTLKKEGITVVSSPTELILSARTSSEERKRTELIFLTPTAFKKDGRYEIFPTVHLILQSLVNKWNVTCPDFPIADTDALEALERGLSIVDYNIRSTRYPLKNTKIPGFVGMIRIESRLSAPLEELWQVLLSFAGYSGVGIKTTLGMGGVFCKPVQKKAVNS